MRDSAEGVLLVFMMRNGTLLPARSTQSTSRECVNSVLHPGGGFPQALRKQLISSPETNVKITSTIILESVEFSMQ